MGRASLACLIAAILLTGCASAPAPAPYPALSWHFNKVEGEGLKLALGPPNTDDVFVMLTCRPKSGEVAISAEAADERSQLQNLTLRSKGISSTTGAKLVKEHLGPRLEAAAPASLPPLAAFAQNGELTIVVGPAVVPTTADRATLRPFFEGCRP